MANWKRFIEVEITHPYITPHRTLGKLKTKIKITSDMTWWSWGVWRATTTIGDEYVGLYGKVSYRHTKKGLIGCNSTYKVRAFSIKVSEGEIPDNNSELFDVRVLSWS